MDEKQREEKKKYVEGLKALQQELKEVQTKIKQHKKNWEETQSANLFGRVIL